MRFAATLAAFAALFALAGGPAGAEEVRRPLGVVELFTSQGCSSCPPADEALVDLAARGDVIALSFHVDYWDYLGWRDTLASPANTQRQQGYSRAFGAQSVYTPQAVINGRTHTSGAKKAEIEQTLSQMGGGVDGMRVDVSADWSGESILIDIGNGFTAHQKAHVLVVYFDSESRVTIERGENKGKTMLYRNAVTSLQSVGMWHGRATRLEVPLGDARRAGTGGCAVLLQKVGKDGVPGPILGATLLPIPAS
ncbi:MAG: DUF1223 domain-containing protein [Rhizobiaceae bacterium]|nr:DUF1223 domain-containing protein [Rhizobiaceae bacterium]